VFAALAVYSGSSLQFGTLVSGTTHGTTDPVQWSITDQSDPGTIRDWFIVLGQESGNPRIRFFSSDIAVMSGLSNPNNFELRSSLSTAQLAMYNCRVNYALFSALGSSIADMFSVTVTDANIGIRAKGTLSSCVVYGATLGAAGCDQGDTMTMRGVYARGCANIWRGQDFTGTFNFIDADSDTWGIRWDGSPSSTAPINRQWSHNFTVKDSSSAAITGAQLALYNASAVQSFNGATDSTGTLSEQIVTEGYFKNATNQTINSYNPFTFRVRKYGYGFVKQTRLVANKVVEGVTLSSNPYATTAAATVAAYTGIAVSWAGSTITVTSAHTAKQLYEFTQYQAALSTSMQYDESLTTTDGSTFILGTGWVLIGASFLSTGTVSGGSVRYSTAGTYTDRLSNTTIDVTGTGTFDFRTATLGGTIHIGSSNSSTCTVQISPSVTYVNDAPSFVTVSATAAVTGTVTGILAGSRVQVYNLTDAVEVYNGVPGTSLTTNYTYTADKSIRIRVMLPGYQWISTTATLGSSGYGVNITQVADPVYVSNGVDGSTLTEFSISGTTIEIYISQASGSDTVPKAYNWWCYVMSTATGIANQDFQSFTATDTAHYTFANGQKFKNSTTTALLLTGAVVKDTSGSVTNCVDTTGGNIYILPQNVETYALSTGSGLSTLEHNQLFSIPTAAAPAASAVASAVWEEPTASHTTGGTFGGDDLTLPTFIALK
jgi:hypothetical protein